MELEVLSSLGPIFRAIYVPYGSHAYPESLASALASLLPQPARVFSIESDLLMPEEGRALAEALTHSCTVLVAGSSESRLIHSLGHIWPDYCEHPSSGQVRIFRHVALEPAKDLGRLASVYLLLPALTSERKSHRPAVFPLTQPDIQRLVSLAATLPSSAEPLGRRGAQIVPAGISMRDLCLLHERDAPLIAPRSRSIGEFINATDPLSWRDLQQVLSAQPDIGLLDHFRGRLTSDQYNFGMAAVQFIEEHRDVAVEGIYPDIYSAVWALEKVLSHGTIFRGQFRAEWSLESTLMRPKDGTLDVAELLHRLNRTSDFISTVRQRSTELFGNQLDEDSLLAVAQHFGFPTPLLDFTESLRVAAFFATREATGDKESEPPIGVIYYIFGADQKHAPIDTPGGDDRLSQWAGVRLGLLHFIRPEIPDGDDRIRRQQAVFIGGYRARHLQAVTIDRIYFRQHAGLTFEDPRSGISREQLLPVSTTLSKLSEEVRNRVQTQTAMSSLLSRTPLSDSSLIGSADAHLYWHLRFGRKYLSDLKDRANEIAAAPVHEAIESALNQYFSMAKVEADISSYPDRQQQQSWTPPIQKTIASLEQAAGVPEGEMWRLVEKQLPQGFESRGHVYFDVPKGWSESAHLAFSCAIFCTAWEHLRCVRGLRAEELVQSAQMYLHGLRFEPD